MRLTNDRFEEGLMERLVTVLELEDCWVLREYTDEEMEKAKAEHRAKYPDQLVTFPPKFKVSDPDTILHGVEPTPTGGYVVLTFANGQQWGLQFAEITND